MTAETSRALHTSRNWYWYLTATGASFLILLNVFKVQDSVARAFGYSGSIPMFALDEMIRGYTPAEAFRVMTEYGEAGRRAYTFLLLTSDLVFPFLYGSFLFLSIRRVTRRTGFPARWSNGLAACGITAACFDYLENLAFLILINEYPSQSSIVARLASFFTVTKFLFSAASLIILATLGIYILGRSLRATGITKSS